MLAVRLGDGFLTRFVGLDFETQTMDRRPARPPAGSRTHRRGRHQPVARRGRRVDRGRRRRRTRSSATAARCGGRTATCCTPTSTMSPNSTGGAESARHHRRRRQRRRAPGDRRRGAQPCSQSDGDTFTTFPVYLPDGSTPIDQDIEQVSTLIGLLGDRRRAGRARPARLDHQHADHRAHPRGRRDASARRPPPTACAAVCGGSRSASPAIALVIGLPLGIVISNLIARMVLEEFVGITPDVAVDWRVFVGQRRRCAARRPTRRGPSGAPGHQAPARRGTPRSRRCPVRSTLDASSGRTCPDRWVCSAGSRRGRRCTVRLARWPSSPRSPRPSVRPSSSRAWRRRSTSSTRPRYEPWPWESLTVARDAGLPLDAAIADGRHGTETGIWTEGELGDWQVDVYGLGADTTMFDAQPHGRTWLDDGERSAVVSGGFADRNDLEVGDRIDLELAPASPSTSWSVSSTTHGRVGLRRPRRAGRRSRRTRAGPTWSGRIASEPALRAAGRCSCLALPTSSPPTTAPAAMRS